MTTTLQGSSPLTTSGVEGQASRLGVVFLRIVAGFAFLREAAWKRPPDFGRDSGTGLWEWSNFAVEYPVFPPYSWFVEYVVQPNFVLFGWGVFFLEAALGAFLILGLLTRLTAVAGLVQSLAITFSVLNQPVYSEWNTAYYLLIGAHLAIIGTAAGRFYGLDAALRPLWRRSGGRLARLLLRAS
jgi:thiosulfate dehydrogenase (quinone) large subunit